MNKSAEFFKNFEIFNNENLGKVRTLTDEENNIWFFANDICECLGYERGHFADRITEHTDPEDRRALKYGDSPESGKSKCNVFCCKTLKYMDTNESFKPKA